MLFNSFDFLVFFPVVAGIYFCLPHGRRWFWLLAASCYFYMAFVPVYILILFLTIVIDYFAGIFIERSRGKVRKWYLIGSILSTCLILFVFKYFNFFNSSLSALANFLHWNYPVGHLSIILPIGLSFHTFQSLSYVIEVYRGKQKAETDFGIYALYVMFFPQLVAGPIERPQNLLHQFYERHDFDYQCVIDGLKRMLWGMFKKVVVADRLAVVVNTVYGNPSEYPAAAHLIATVFFAFQIYCDFSGYSDIAIGAAKVMGFRLMDNFNRPYFSKSVAEFWKRWHISLSTWFKDYVYIPLGGSRVSQERLCFNLFVTFLISGLWHGANWTYVIWGALNGFYLVCSILTADLRRRFVRLIKLDSNPHFYKFFQIGVTFALTCFAWIIFRSAQFDDAVYIVKSIGSLAGRILMLDFSFVKDIARLPEWGLSWFEFCIALATIGVMEAVHMAQRRTGIRDILAKKPLWCRWAVYYAAFFMVIVLGKFDQGQFIYFQF